MNNKPKTKEVVRTIKEHTASMAKDKAVQVGVKTKDTVKAKAEEQFSPQQDRRQEQSPESYASDQVTETGQRAVEDAVVIGERAVKTTVRKVREKHAEKKLAEKQAEVIRGETNTDAAEIPESESVAEPSAESSELSSGDMSTAAKDQPKGTSKTLKTRDVAASKDSQGTEPAETQSQAVRENKSKGKTSSKYKNADTISKPESPEQTMKTAKQQSQVKKQPDSKTLHEDTGSSGKQKIRTKEADTAIKDKRPGSVRETDKTLIRRKIPEQTAIKERVFRSEGSV